MSECGREVWEGNWEGVRGKCGRVCVGYCRRRVVGCERVWRGSMGGRSGGGVSGRVWKGSRRRDEGGMRGTCERGVDVGVCERVSGCGCVGGGAEYLQHGDSESVGMILSV